jgi:hypothetical protein
MSAPAGTPAPGHLERMGTMLQLALEPFAERIAEIVVRKLCSSNFDGYIDQTKSPLGPRRHINAIRSGELPGLQVGRRYLAREDHVQQYTERQAAKQRKVAEPAAPKPSMDALAKEMGLVKRRK